MIYSRKYFLLIFIIFITSIDQVNGKESLRQRSVSTDQLLDYYRSIRNPSLLTTHSSGITRDRKCGFWIGAQILNNWSKFSPVQRMEIKGLMQPGSMQCDTIAGHFRIHYDTNGVNAPSMINRHRDPISGSAKTYIDSVASIFNHVWSVEVDQMGYSAPPIGMNDQYYDVYVEDLQYYGLTTPDSQINGSAVHPQYTSHIEIDNDFKEDTLYNTFGINALEVTAAHEFHHAIQFGYGFWYEDIYAYELTSTWFEDVVYNDVNDYYYYLSDYFNGFYTGLPFNTDAFAGYERSIWAHYLAKRFSPDLMRDVWTAMRSQPFLESTESVLSACGSDLKSAFAEFTYWNYFTKNRANPDKFYPEGENYPLFQPLQKLQFTGGTTTVNGNVYELSSSVYEFDIPNDTLNIIVANVDVDAAKRREQTTRRIDITLSTQPLSQPYTTLTKGQNVKISTADPSLWRYFFSQETLITNAAPNPLQLTSAQRLLLPINEDRAQTANVYFYTSSLSLAYSGEFTVSYEYGTRAIIVSTSQIRSKLSSGVYFIIAKTVNHDYKWKVAVIR